MTTVLVTGASGFVGRYVVEELLKQNVKVKTFDIGESPNKKVDHTTGKIQDAKAVTTAMENCDVVLHLAGVMGSSNYGFNHSVHVTGTRNVIAAAKALGVKRIISYSTVAAMRKNPGAYGATKKKAEKLLLKSGLDCTIIRPTMVLGSDGKGIKTIIKQVKSYPFFIPLLGSGKSLRQPIYVEDLAKLTVGSISKKATYGKTYFAAGKETITFLDIVKTVKETLGVKKLLIPIPLFVAKIIAFVLDKALKNPPFTPENVRNLGFDEVVDGSSLEKDVGIQTQPLDVILPKSILEAS